MFKVALLILVGCLYKYAYADTFDIGLIEHPPYVNVSEGAVTGYLLDNLLQASVLTGDQITYRVFPLARGLIELKARRIDIILPTSSIDSQTLKVGNPIFYEVPGLCFLKSNFIPILSASKKFNDITITYPNGIKVPDFISNNGGDLVEVSGNNFWQRSIDMLQAHRMDAFFTHNPTYSYFTFGRSKSPIACSAFSGMQLGVYALTHKYITPRKLSAFSRLLNLTVNPMVARTMSIEPTHSTVRTDKYQHLRLTDN